MKKLFLLCFSLMLFLSCGVDDDSAPNFDFEFIPIEEVNIAEEFVLGEIYQIGVTYYRPSTCHNFHDFYYVVDGNEITIAVINIVYDDSGCELLEDQLVEKAFDFHDFYNQAYIFKFWQGEDENGDDVYLIYEVPVVD